MKAPRLNVSVLAVLLTMAAAAACQAGMCAALVTRGAAAPAARARAWTSLSQLPLYFVENKGQVHGMRGYYVPGSREALYFSPEGVTYALASGVQGAQRAPRRSGIQGDSRLDSSTRLSPPGPPNSRLSPFASRLGVAVRQEFVGGRSDVRPEGTRVAGARFSYFRGKASEWKTVRSFSEVAYRQVWPGIDAVFHGQVSKLKYEYRVAAGADPNEIRLRVRGASVVRVDEAGRLVAETAAGNLTDEKPYAYQEIDGQRVEVPCAYRLPPPGADGTREYEFAVGQYDRSRELVLDPATLVYCGYIGGSEDDLAESVAVDAAGSAYVSGTTSSDPRTFPVRVGPLLVHNDGESLVPNPSDAFVTKLTPDGNGLEYCGYIGGTGNDEGFGIALDAAGSAYVAGFTQSDQSSFPVRVGPSVTLDTHPDIYGFVQGDAFVAKVKPDGTGLEYCGYIGGDGFDEAFGIAVDAAGSAYVTGLTTSDQTSFPVNTGPSLAYSGVVNTDDVTAYIHRDAFVAKVRPDGSGLEYCGYIGGDGADQGQGIAVDAAGNAYVAGFTNSTPDTFPVKTGPSLTSGGSFDAFVTKVKADGTGFEYCGYIGGKGDELANGIAVDGDGSAYLAGYTNSDQTSMPVKVGPTLRYSGGSQFGDAFVAKVKPDGTSLEYCGYIGGIQDDLGYGIAVDSAGRACVVGLTVSDQGSFPVKDGPSLTFGGVPWDAFVAKLKPDGSGFEYSGFIGGSDYDDATSVALDAAGNAYVVGNTRSGPDSFPVAVGPSLTPGGGYDAFVAKVPTAILPVAPGNLTVAAPPTPVGGTELDLTWTDNSDNETSWLIQRSSDNGQTWTSLPALPTISEAQTGGIFSYQDTGLSQDTPYWYRMAAVDAEGPSPFAGPVTASTLLLPPSPPSALQVTTPAPPAGSTQLDLTWTDTSDHETGWIVRRFVIGIGHTDLPVSSTTTSQTGETVSFHDTGLAANAGYTYQVAATNAAGQSDWSRPVRGTTLPLAPAAPTGLTLAVQSSSWIAASWTDHSTNESSFLLERSADGGKSWTSIDSPATPNAAGTGETLTWQDHGLTAKTAYRYRVSALNASGVSLPDGPVSATTPGPGHLVVTPTALPFGPVKVGKTRKLPVTLKNTGKEPLGVDVSAATGAFSASETGWAALKPGKSLRVTVTFTPAATGKATGTLPVASDDPKRAAVTVKLTGAGKKA